MTYIRKGNSSDEFDKSNMKLLGKKFDDLATGRNQVPNQRVISTFNSCAIGSKRQQYQDALTANAGPLFQHFMASIPCIQEELARVGIALAGLTKKEFRRKKGKNLLLEIDAFDGSNARALVSFSNGHLRSLTCSPNVSNQKYFDQHADKSVSKYFPKSFFDLPVKIQDFEEGFDFIYEMAAFQFYGPNRQKQLEKVAKLMRSDGVAIFLEKMNQEDEEEYLLREIAKDTLFKTRYFMQEEIEWKATNFLRSMRQGQVTLQEFVRIASKVFKYVKVIWHSTNFYEVVASNDQSRISNFLSFLDSVAIEPQFKFDVTDGQYP